VLEFYDSLFRFWAFGIFTFLGVLVLRDFGRSYTGVLGLCASFSAAGYLLCASSYGGSQFGALAYFIWPFCIMGSVSIWLFSLSQFQDHFRIGTYHWAVIIIYLILASGRWFSVSDISNQIFDVLNAGLRLLLLMHMVYVAWQGRADDLLEVRRKFRGIYIGAVTLVSFVIWAIEILHPPVAASDYLLLFQAFSFVVLSSLIAWYALNLRTGVLAMTDKGDTKEVSASDDVSEKHDLKIIMNLIVDEKKYLEAGLTITKLAHMVNLPEHRLRRLINQHMGYRNFADFLNHYRIAEAQMQLAGTENRHQQILTLAMDLGYGSLGPFNRAFKERTGQTPSEFRKKALAEIE